MRAMLPLLHTDRLSLQPCQISHLDALHQLWIEADVRRFLFDDCQISQEEARSFLEASTTGFTNHGYGIWLFFEHQSHQLAGFSGLLHKSQEPPNLIFGTQPQLWGRGYAREATNSVLRYALDVLGLKRVVADVDEFNYASIRVLEAVGMFHARSAIDNERSLLYYEIQV
jgi:RimJ/RimL family protein N-acetyltransferase